MIPLFITPTEADSRQALPLYAVLQRDLNTFLERLGPRESAWLKSTAFGAKNCELALLPGADGALAGAVLGLGKGQDVHALALFSERLPKGTYRLENVPQEFGGARAAYAWAIGTYRFGRYRMRPGNSGEREGPRLVVPDGVDAAAVRRIAEGVFLARDLINTPANDLGPAELEQAARTLAAGHGAAVNVIEGDALLQENYPLVHWVGRASVRPPRLIDITWGKPEHPKVTLVGKGVCFDSGGLDLKSAAGMATMKKDMGGAACVLAVASMVMGGQLPVRLRVLIPAVENSVSGGAFRPGDVLPSRKGLYVEIGNTDAEGRLILADALAEADKESPALMFCVATLTGAARAATGMELPPFFTDDDALAGDLMDCGRAENDHLWRLPLWRSYDSAIDSNIADVNNAPDYPLAGAITAALFLDRFVGNTKCWAHFDIPAWVDRPKPGRRRG
ncbi:MAG TPA: leucyl aminopeptidase family protein, partial [Micropepsaceae bacterium]|nr:leucyl aminopeptidase family protein [Micropepsaceae bacterium]